MSVEKPPNTIQAARPAAPPSPGPGSATRRQRQRAYWRSVRSRMRKGWRRLMRLEGSPRAIALGTAIGVFVAFSPTIGFQMFIAAFIAGMVRANPVPAAAVVWITNPLTIPPFYAATYWVGSFFWPGEPLDIYGRMTTLARQLTRFQFYEIVEQFRELLRLGVDVIVPMFIGGIFVGLAAGAITYPIVLITVTRARRLYQIGRRKLEERRGH